MMSLISRPLRLSSTSLYSREPTKNGPGSAKVKGLGAGLVETGVNEACAGTVVACEGVAAGVHTQPETEQL